jgi:hypothetical protein
MQKLNDAIDGVDDRAITLKDGVDSLSGNIGTLAGNVGALQSLIRKTTEENVSVVNVKYNGTGTSKVKLDGDSILITGVDGTRITDTDSVTLASENEIVIDIDTGGAYSGKLHFYRNLPSAASLLEDHLAFVIGPQDATKQGVLFKCIRKDVGQQTLYEWEPISLKVSANSEGSYDIPSVVLRSNTLTLVTAGGDEAVLDGAGIEANATYTISGGTGVIIDAPDGNIILDADEVNLTGNITGGYIRSGKKAGTTAGAKATAEGKDTIASGEAAHAEGGSYTDDGHTYYTTASGKYSHAEGEGTVAGGEASHAEGVNAFIAAFAKAAHAEGLNTSVNATCAHAEGEGAVASGRGAHAEGDGTTASGNYSHAGGRSTISQRRAQTVIGEYNVADTEGADGTARGKYAFIIGNGDSTNARHNAFAVDWTGNTEIYGVLDVADNTYLHGDLTVSDIIVGESDIYAGGNVIADEYVIGEGHTGTTASGNPISIPDALPADVKSCVVGIEPIQDLHGYDKPWTGGCGKNLLPMIVDKIKALNTSGTWTGNQFVRNGVTFTLLTDNSNNVTGIKVYGTPTAEFEFTITSRASGNDAFLPAGSYILYQGTSDTTKCRMGINTQSGTTLAYSGSTFTISTLERHTVWVTFYNGVAVDLTLYPQIEAGSTITSFEPYSNICPISGIDSVAVTVSDGTTPETTTIPLGQTVYGGTLDVKSGVLTVDRGYIASYSGQTLPGAWISDRDVYTGSNSPTTGAQVVYELATPTTIQLSPKRISLLKGQNVITVNGNTIIAVEYHPDIVPYVDDAVDGMDAMISDNVEGDTASKAYAVNDFMIRPDGLYKVTAPIANGAALTNNNVLLSTIAKELTKIANFLSTGGAGFHNSIYRGKYLGSSVTPEQWLAISSGMFGDMFIGDYWEIDSVKWRIAAFDYHLNRGPNNGITTRHHLVIVPDSNLLAANGSTHYMQTSNDTSGGYKGSGYYSGTNKDGTTNSAKSQCTTKINNAFGAGHILTHKELITNAVTDGKASGWGWEDCTVECMSETMVYGTQAWAANGYEVASEMTQLPLFFFKPEHITNRANWWLRSVTSASNFAHVYFEGRADGNNASAPWIGVRPYFLLTA